MGWLDKDDLKCWVNLILEQNSNANIILHGSSMGAATVLMASGDELPQNVKAIIADSGYTSVWDTFHPAAAYPSQDHHPHLQTAWSHMNYR